MERRPSVGGLYQLCVAFLRGGLLCHSKVRKCFKRGVVGVSGTYEHSFSSTIGLNQFHHPGLQLAPGMCHIRAFGWIREGMYCANRNCDAGWWP